MAIKEEILLQPGPDGSSPGPNVMRDLSGDHLNLALGLKNATLPAIIMSLFPSYQI